MDGAPPARITGRYLGSTTAIGRTHLYFDQQEFRRNVGVYSDLYALAATLAKRPDLLASARLTPAEQRELDRLRAAAAPPGVARDREN